MQQATFRSARWAADTGRLEVSASERVGPKAQEVQIAVGSAGICGSDLHSFRGDFSPRVGRTPGHEIAGTVSAVSGGVRHVKEGDVVGIEPLLRCGFCRFCMSGDYNICTERGLIGAGVDGGMSEFVNVPANTVYRVPTGVDTEVGALAEPLACSVHGFERVRLKGSETVLIVGAGTIGLTAILAARARGARVIVLARHPHQRDAALKCGATEVIDESEAGKARLEELTSLRAIDVSAETVGGQGDALIQAQRAVRPKGRVLVLGVFTVPTLTIDGRYLSGPEVEIIGSMVYSARDGRSDYQVALEIIADNVEAARSLITHRFSLDDVQTAFETALDKSTKSIKVHLHPA